MIEIALYNEREQVTVEQQGDVVRVHAGVGHSSEHIASALESNGLPQHCAEAVDLFSNDDAPRNFDHQGDFVLITRGEPSA